MSRVAWVTGSATMGRGSQCHGHLCCTQGFGVRRHWCCRQGGWSHRHLCGWRDGVAGSAAPSFPVAMGATAASKLELSTPPPQLLPVEFSEALGPASMARITGTTSTSPPVPPLLCVPVHSPLDVQMCGTTWCPGVWGRGTFAELWMFYWL